MSGPGASAPPPAGCTAEFAAGYAAGCTAGYGMGHAMGYAAGYAEGYGGSSHGAARAPLGEGEGSGAGTAAAPPSAHSVSESRAAKRHRRAEAKEAKRQRRAAQRAAKFLPERLLKAEDADKYTSRDFHPDQRARILATMAREYQIKEGECPFMGGGVFTAEEHCTSRECKKRLQNWPGAPACGANANGRRTLNCEERVALWRRSEVVSITPRANHAL
jgi:hypothetical protein